MCCCSLVQVFEQDKIKNTKPNGYLGIYVLSGMVNNLISGSRSRGAVSPSPPLHQNKAYVRIMFYLINKDGPNIYYNNL